ncbi:MAG: TIGR03617 family F420-dependent LLM class oxidoreductase [Minwuia sp.]|uniref:TIGR03617 family F420-dependent LLM class oxidoreductase n=1 Tax=Minwuia sp. TaxID=2493630 RepID=UPI003A8BC6C9
MKIYYTMPRMTFRQTADAAKQAESLGYDGITTTETNRDPFLPLAVAASVTEKIELATGVAIAFPRSPMVVAEMGWDIQESSKGRFILGIGSQVKGHNERRFSVPWSAPAPRMKEYVQSLRAIWQAWADGSTDLGYIGKHYSFTLMTPNFMPPKMGMVGAPITIASVGPAMLRVAGEVCDGARLHGFCTRKYFENVISKELQTGYERGGRKRENMEISGGGFIATGPDEETTQKMYEWIRYRVAFYGSTRTYWPVFEQHDLLDLGEELHRMSVAQRWDEMAQVVPDDVVDLFCARGTWENIAGEIEKRFGGMADIVSIQSELGDDSPMFDPGLIQDIQKIPTVFEGFDLPKAA